MGHPIRLFACAALACSLAACAAAPPAQSRTAIPPPAPLNPVPSPAQLAWYENELTLFVHFNMNTFTGRSTGLGNEDPKLFNPSDLDCLQWARVAQETGFKGIILTAKHHDGFCIWQTATTEHSIKNSPWKDGHRDVVRELADACKQYHLKLGIYCSPWDRSQPNYDTDKPAYARLYRQQLTELLSNYGPIYEMWFDGNRANVADWPNVINVVRTLQPHAVIKQGPKVEPIAEDLRWVGNELACAPLTNWSVYPPPDTPSTAPRQFFPVECDTILVGGWFWNDKPPADLATVLNWYYTSIGRNSVLLLNVAPDKRGRFSDESVLRLHQFHDALTQIFGANRATGAHFTASNTRGNDPAFAPANLLGSHNYWATDDGVTAATLEIDLPAPQEFNVIRLEEEIALGQRIQQYKVEALINNSWQSLSTGTTIGYRKLDRIPPVTASKLRLTILQSRGPIALRGFGLHLDTISPAAAFQPANALLEVKPGTRLAK